MITRKSWPTLYVKTSSGSLNFWRVWTEGAEVKMQWGQIDGIPLDDGYTAEAKNLGRANETTPAQQAELEAQSSFDKKLRVKYRKSLKAAKTEINIKPMRAYTLDAKRMGKLKFPVYVQPKFNGVRCMAYPLPCGNVRLMSRGGKDYSLPHIQDELRGTIPAGWCLDGELYAHHVSLQEIRHRIASKDVNRDSIQLHCYDMLQLPPTDITWDQRKKAMFAWFKGKNLRSVVPSTGFEVVSTEAIEDAHDSWVMAGYEGLMLRTLEGTYRMAAKSTHLLKYKKFKDEEFRVSGYEAGKDGVILYRCYLPEGGEFLVRPMGTKAQRAKMWEERRSAIGRFLTVKYQERSDDNIPLMPVGVSFRPEEDLDS